MPAATAAAAADDARSAPRAWRASRKFPEVRVGEILPRVDDADRPRERE